MEGVIPLAESAACRRRGVAAVVVMDLAGWRYTQPGVLGRAPGMPCNP